MMEPERLLEDAETPPELRALLRKAPRARALDAVTQARVRKQLLKPFATPSGALVRSGAAAPVAAGLSALLSASAVSAAIGVAAGVVTIGALVYGEGAVNRLFAPPSSASVGAPRGALEAPALRPSASNVSLPARRAAPLAPPPIERPRETFAPAANGLGEESRLLERARSELQREPRRALDLAREHGRRFEAPRLAQERTLIEVDALYRLGRYPEARALAERSLAAGAGNLYEARLRRLLDAMARTQPGARQK
jgi:hypothetical protein